MILAWLYVLSGGAAEWICKRCGWRNWWRCVAFLLLASAAFGQDDLTVLWSHVYHPGRLQVRQAVGTVTGITVDATHGKKKNGCRSEADGDLHCWLKLDAGQELLINEENVKNQNGNLVFEPMCQHRVTQADAMAACKDWTQKITLPPIGSHVKLTGSWVLDAQHGHMEIHPVTSIEVIP